MNPLEIDSYRSATTWNALGRVGAFLGLDSNNTTASTSKALGRLANILGHDTTQTATASKALGALAVAEQDILPSVG